MREHLTLGPVPAEEDCAQVGEDGYGERALEECRRYIALLRKKFGPEPDGTRLTTKSFPHDFGSYLEVVVKFDDTNERAVAYAFELEGEAPARWDAPEDCAACAADVAEAEEQDALPTVAKLPTVGDLAAKMAHTCAPNRER